MPKGLVLAMVCEKAYNTITFEHAHVLFQLMGLPTGMMALMMQLLHSPVSFCIQGIVIPDVVWTPEQESGKGTHFPQRFLCSWLRLLFPFCKQYIQTYVCVCMKLTLSLTRDVCLPDLLFASCLW